jgi:nucleoside-diphosphate-sugar epimerase
VQSGEQPPILVVGGAGYIGSLLVRRLLDAGRKVRVLDRLVYGAEPIRDILNHSNLELVVGDCRNIQNVVAAVKGVESIVHLAAIVGDPACEQDRQTALETNYAATRMLIEIAKGARVRSLVFASSCSVYGSSENLMSERSAVEPISLYAQTKLDSERALLDAKSDSFHPTILRFATVFGNSFRPRFDLAVNLLTAKAHQDGVITIYNGEQWRPFIHVRDVVEAIVMVLNAPEALVSGEIFNVGDSRLNFTLAQVADQIKQHFPALRVEHVENTDRRNYRVSFDKIKNHLGFHARITLQQGIAEIKAALEGKAIPDYTDVVYHNQRFLQMVGPPLVRDVTDSGVMAAFARAISSHEVVPQPSRASDGLPSPVTH